jgi:ribonuclease R
MNTNPDTMEEKILELLRRPGHVPANVPELLQLLDLPRNQQQPLQHALRHLETRGLILRTKGNRYILAQEADLVPGVISINRGGKGFLQPDEPGLPEIVVPESATATALNGDRVLVRRDVSPQGLRGPKTPSDSTGSVVRILERKRLRFVGTLQTSKQFLFVIPDDSRIAQHIYVPTPRDVGRPAHVGDKVVVEITHWESRETNPEGEIIEVLGAPDEEGVDMLSVVKNYDLPLHFPKNVLHEANAIAKSHALDETGVSHLDGRVDCREHQVITIDPDDAKDFDDAICLQRIAKDRVKFWVHIADVSHYVKPGNALDAEARKRGNSTYLVDRVIPMLPEALSNGLCSLKPGVDRLTKCAEFLLTETGEVLETKFYSAVIHSKRRFTYKEALQILLQKPSQDPIERMLHSCHGLAQHIRRRRFKAGSLDMDFPENKIRLDAEGRVVAIERMENDVSHQLIEEYMLLANEAVAAKLMGLRTPAVYRVHEAPKPSRLEQYRDDVLSHHIPCGDLTLKSEAQKLLQRLKTLPIGPALKIGFLRSMMRARYGIEPLGHYGLAKAEYTHFTSPIRRYADLVVHRVLFENANLMPAALKEIADHISSTERNSADAERDSREVKLYAYLMAQLKSGKRQVYPALVTDVRNFGFNVEVSTLGLSGLVHLSAMQDDFYVLDPVRSQLVGRGTGRVIKLGDNLMVQVCRVDAFKKQVDFQIAGSGNESRSRDGQRSRDDRGRHEDRGRGRDRGRGSSPDRRSTKQAPSGTRKSSSSGGPRRKSR